MASEAHNVRKQKVLHIEGCPIDLPRRRISSSTKKIMKEGKKSPKQLASYTNRITVGKTVTSPLSFFKVVYCKRKVHCYSPKPCYRKKQLPKSRGCDMANKENELACAGNLPAKLHIDSSTYLLNSSDSRSSQTEDPSSKFSGFFSEISQDHETMNQVLFSRNLRLNVALTFWRRRSINELVAYLLRIQDLGVLVDCLPVLTNSLQEENPYVSVGCCVDLFPLVKSLLNSKYEEYVIVGLNWLQAVIKTWWSELSAHTEKAEDGNTHILKKQLSGLWEQMNHLTMVPGYTGNIAKVEYQELQYVRNFSIWCDLMKVAVRKDLKQMLSYVQDLSELEKNVLLRSEGSMESIILLPQNLLLCIKQDVKAYLLQLQ